jgi:hypothetical protein
MRLTTRCMHAAMINFNLNDLHYNVLNDNELLGGCATAACDAQVKMGL